MSGFVFGFCLGILSAFGGSVSLLAWILFWGGRGR